MEKEEDHGTGHLPIWGLLNAELESDLKKSKRNLSRILSASKNPWVLCEESVTLPACPAGH
jgi:hypothetical protein